MFKSFGLAPKICQQSCQSGLRHYFSSFLVRVGNREKSARIINLHVDCNAGDPMPTSADCVGLMIEPPSALDTNGASMEQRHITRLTSNNFIERADAAQWLREHGGPETADKLDGMLRSGRLSTEARTAVGFVLLSLSYKHDQFPHGRSKLIASTLAPKRPSCKALRNLPQVRLPVRAQA